MPRTNPIETFFKENFDIDIKKELTPQNTQQLKERKKELKQLINGYNIVILDRPYNLSLESINILKSKAYDYQIEKGRIEKILEKKEE